MRTVEVDESTFNKLCELAANHYAVKGQPPAPLSEVLEKMVRDKWQHYNPPVYQTSGFERL